MRMMIKVQRQWLLRVGGAVWCYELLGNVSQIRGRSTNVPLVCGTLPPAYRRLIIDSETPAMLAEVAAPRQKL